MRIPWNKGIPRTAEERRKISEAKKGKPGRLHTEEFKVYLSKSRKGIGNPFHGKRHSEESRRKMSGKFGSLNPNWKGGYVLEGYPPEFNQALKNRILERDRRQCRNPGCWGRYLYLTVHHINYDKSNCDDTNLITVCNSCNSRANARRHQHLWISFYTIIVEERNARMAA